MSTKYDLQKLWNKLKTKPFNYAEMFDIKYYFKSPLIIRLSCQLLVKQSAWSKKLKESKSEVKYNLYAAYCFINTVSVCLLKPTGIQTGFQKSMRTKLPKHTDSKLSHFD